MEFNTVKKTTIEFDSEEERYLSKAAYLIEDLYEKMSAERYHCISNDWQDAEVELTDLAVVHDVLDVLISLEELELH